MRRSIAFTLLLDLTVAAFGNECSPGHKHKANLTGLMCIDATKTAANCNSECCEADESTCGGIEAKKSTTIVCPYGQYKDVTSDAWKKTPTTTKTMVTKCCKAKATCDQLTSATLPAGFVSTGTNKKAFCEGDVKSCGQSGACVKVDTLKCRGDAKGDTLAKAQAACKAGSKVLKEKWEGILLNGKTFEVSCCQEVACSSTLITCYPGTKKAGTAAAQPWKKAKETPLATKDTTKCTETTVAKCKEACCVADEKTCGGLTFKTQVSGAVNAAAITCGTDTYIPTTVGTIDDSNLAEWRKRPVTAAGGGTPTTKEITAACCLSKPKCSTHYCPAGMKKKKSVTSTTTCSRLGACDTECCEADQQKCGSFLTSLACPYGTFDESAAWVTTGTAKTTKAVMDAWKNKAGNVTTKNVNCCTPREACRLPVLGTTTPGVIATTTPAAPALKFSEHKAAVDASSDRPWGASMVCLGVGALIGMGVLMIVQVFRSKNQHAQAEDEDGDMLLGTSE